MNLPSIQKPRDIKRGEVWYYIAYSRRSIDLVVRVPNVTTKIVRLTRLRLQRMLDELKPAPKRR